MSAKVRKVLETAELDRSEEFAAVRADARYAEMIGAERPAVPRERDPR